MIVSKFLQKPKKIVATSLLLVVLALAVWLLKGILFPSPLSAILKNQKLVVLTGNSATTYYESAEGPAGFEYDLCRAFAEHLGVELKVRVLNSTGEILAAMRDGEGDIAAANLTITEQRQKEFIFGPAYYTVQQQVVCHRDSEVPATLAGLAGYQLMVVANSSYVERLAEVKKTTPELSWQTSSDISTEQLLEMVWQGKLDCTVADSNIVAINRRYFPELAIVLPISEEQQLAWILRDGGTGLYDELECWLAAFEESGGLANLKDRYYAYTDIFDYVDLSYFHRNIGKRLPKYEKLFQEAASRYDIPFALLAALGYQESHWNPRARSPTGVRGIMMLTLNTAREMGVKSRLDPGQSIMGGAKYLARILSQVPASLVGDDRLNYALAAYNVGLGHMDDARILAGRQGKDPDSWNDLKTVLPLLAQKKYYKTLKHGYARGLEPVRFVERIVNYRDILNQKYSQGS